MQITFRKKLGPVRWSADLSSVGEEEAMAVESLSPIAPTPILGNKGFFLAVAHNVIFRAFCLLTLISPVLSKELLELDNQSYEALSLSLPLFPCPKKGANTLPTWSRVK